MKKLMITLTAMAMGMLMCGAVYAGSCGSMTVPALGYKYKSGSSGISSSITLSNITNEEVDVTVDFYDQDGALLTTNGIVVKGSYTLPYRPTLASGTNTFTIPAHGTRTLTYYTSSGQYFIEGHAIVKWQSLDSSLRKALIGAVKQSGGHGNYYLGWSAMPINNGLPF